MTELLRMAIRQACRRPEAECVAALVAEVEALDYDRATVRTRATTLVEAVRRQRSHASGVDHLMHEFSLSSQEGVALMCLAEALLRIPDRATADRLIRDKISHGDWKAHLGGSPSLFVNAATWGLMLTGKLVVTHSHGALGNALTRILMKGGEPLIRKSVDFAMRLLGQQFVMGEDIESALARSRTNELRGYRHSFDMLGEAALTDADAERYCRAYEMAIHAIGRAATGRGVKDGPGISVKLSALHPRYSRSQRERVLAELLPRLKHLMKLARDFDIGFNIDAEEADRLELSLDLLDALAGDPELSKWDGMGFVVQAYQKRAPCIIDWLIDLARRHRRRLMIRLVKGAYWDSEIKRAQVDGLPDYPVYTRKPHSDLAYLVCAGRLLAAGDAVFPQFATHNAHTLATVAEMARASGVDDYEFQCLHGMGEPLYDNVVAVGEHRPCRIYSPVGTHETLLPYLVRRLLENGANSSFVNRIVDENVTVAQLIEDPLDQVRRHGSGPHPAIPLPPALYGPGRRNSLGLDLADEGHIARVQQTLAGPAGRRRRAVPLLAGATPAGGPAQAVRNPARHADVVGEVVEATRADIEPALAAAATASADWHATPVTTRAAILLNAAELLEAERLPLLDLCVREAGKTWGNAVGEIREAVDFCRYYAQQLSEGHFHNAATPPGVAVCISPWNFPLAIFLGEISAALAAGSPVIAKPAEQTPLIAHFAVELLHRAGVPPAVLQLLPGRGETVGAALVADARVASVVFTGSTEVARLINAAVAERPGVRLIAETGGQNAMIVDSSALAEQVVQDALVSGFDSAGQRCSALRVLCLQEDIAERTLPLLRAAMAELTIGDPLELATDIGPVIDAEAQQKLLAHIDQMRALGRPVYQLQLPAACAGGCFVPPTLIEIEALTDLTGEVFGPVVHVLRYADGELDSLLSAINGLGYGLTLGVHSRIDETVGHIVAAARVGNIYVNRNMVGAVVGVQPFGGEGLSGTGPKAGGPLYLQRLGGSEESMLSSHPGRRQASLHDPHSAFRLLAEWAFTAGRRDLAQQCTEYAERSLLHVCFDLPGPTGERNCLAFAPRGRLLCLAADDDEWLRQLAAAFATGNTVAALDDAAAPRRRTLLPEQLAASITWVRPDDFTGLAGVLAEQDDAALRHRLAAEPGPLLALYLPGAASRRYPLYRLLAERVVSTNTTAAGGNTTLMTLGA